MNVNQQNKLLGCLKNGLQEAGYDEGRLTFFKSPLEAGREICAASKGYLTNGDALGLLIDEIRNHFENKNEGIAPHHHMINNGEAETIARSIIRKLSEIPCTYHVLFRLPLNSKLQNVVPLEKGEWSLFLGSLSEYSNQPESLEQADPSGDSINAFITWKYSGFITNSSNLLAMDSIASKACLVIFFLEVFGGYWPRYGEGNDLDRLNWIFSLNKGDELKKLEMPGDLTSHFARFGFLQENELQLERTVWALAAIEKIPNGKAQHLINAIHWYVNAQADQSMTSSIIKLGISLDALFGTGSQERGLTAAISDRFAYLMARDLFEREKIAKRITEFYQLRSKLVHGVKTTLGQADLSAYRLVCSMQMDALKTELNSALDLPSLEKLEKSF